MCKHNDAIDHFAVVCLVACPLNESEAGVDLIFMKTSLVFFCKFLLISMIKALFLHNKNREVSIKTRSTPASLSFKGQAPKHTNIFR